MIKGGSRAKKCASKNKKQMFNKDVRLADNEDEIYAIVTKILGGGHLDVLVLDKQNTTSGFQPRKAMCRIGGKFRSERIVIYQYLLVGKRSGWSSSNFMVDLLEVYNDTEKTKLIKKSPNINWSLLESAILTIGCGGKNVNDDIEFSNDQPNDNIQILQPKNEIISLSTVNEVVEEFNFDDI